MTTAGSVPQALALLTDGGTDLLVSDIGMPGQDGLDLIVAGASAGRDDSRDRADGVLYRPGEGPHPGGRV